MILTALRLSDTGELATRLVCDDEDFNSAMAIDRVLIRHTIRVYRELSSADLGKPAAERSDRQQQFLSSLPLTFSTQAFIQMASRLGIPQPTAERYIKNWCQIGLLHRNQATGDTAIGYIHTFVIDQAKNLLMKGHTVGEVADLLGFEYPHHFSRLFKKVTGMTPTEFVE